MEVAEFEEKQFESGLQWELSAQSPDFFPSAGVLEAAVGYDFALSPGKVAIWDLLQAGFPPGVLLTPALWPGSGRPATSRLPDRLVSLIVQAKRPEWLDHWRAGQYHHWRGPYFRFRTNAEQQRVLEHLERAIAAKALVRYASPAFLGYGELLRHQRAAMIAENSSFVSPAVLAGHQIWSYDGPGTMGYANPGDEGESYESDTIETLLGRASELAEPQSLREHLFALAETDLPVEPATGSWINLLLGDRRLRSDGTIGPSEDDQTLPETDVPEDAPRVAAAWATFASAVALAGGFWFVLGFRD